MVQIDGQIDSYELHFVMEWENTEYLNTGIIQSQISEGKTSD